MIKSLFQPELLALTLVDNAVKLKGKDEAIASQFTNFFWLR
ncbi:hypothetical protein [Fortiea sp. LEGE XX443]